MVNNGKIDIAVGHSAQSVKWKNKSFTWSQFVDRIAETTFTHETYKEFIASSKAEQLKIKDQGGFVGGYLRNGKRSPKSVVHRQLLTLDIDFAHLDFWGDFTLQFENAAVLHGTHKHSKTDPRYRLLMPIDREVTPDEYVAIARAVAGRLNIELFDQTTFETNRLMFWPSTPKDVEYYMVSQEGPWLNADEILNSYIDWTDTSLWPTSGQMLRELGANAKKQADPSGKSGIVGAFCRTFSITEAIDKFLAQQYIPTDHGDRYTYTQGSTAAGLIIYEDTFAYSHHGTDPCSGKTSNSFDLVRLHLFGHLDNESQVQGQKPKSFVAMEDFARGDKSVKKLLAEESQSSTRYDFAEVLDGDYEQELEAVEGDQYDIDWMVELEADNKGNYLSTASNISLIFKMDSRLREAFRQNLFDNKRYVYRPLPWRGIKKPEPIKNVDYSGIRNYIETMYGVTGIQKIDDALALEFERHSFHPVKDYLDGLEWDKIERLEHLLVDYFGSVDNIYTRESVRKCLVGAVARIFNPGRKFDLVLTLIGPQGCNKSTFIDKLGKDWYSDSFTTVHGKESFEQLQGAWLIEIAEMSGFRKADNEAIKLFISKRIDTFRPAYGRSPEDFPRQNIFIATSNTRNLFTDPTGGRRFLPVDVVPEDALKDVWRDLDGEVDQIWAEAVALYKAGETLYLSPEAEAIARYEQTSHSDTDERRGLIEFYLDRQLPKNWETLGIDERRMFLNDPEAYDDRGEMRERVCMAEIWTECLGKNKEDMTRYLTRDINDIMKSFPEWEYKQTTANFGAYGKQKYYQRRKP